MRPHRALACQGPPPRYVDVRIGKAQSHVSLEEKRIGRVDRPKVPTPEALTELDRLDSSFSSRFLDSSFSASPSSPITSPPIMGRCSPVATSSRLGEINGGQSATVSTSKSPSINLPRSCCSSSFDLPLPPPGLIRFSPAPPVYCRTKEGGELAGIAAGRSCTRRRRQRGLRRRGRFSSLQIGRFVWASCSKHRQPDRQIQVLLF